MWKEIIGHFNSYVGGGLIFFCYLSAVIFLFITEKRKERRILFIYMPLIVLFIFLNPLTAILMKKFADEDIYYRLLWILPVTITIGDTLTEVIIRFKGKLKVFLVAGSAILLILGGRLVYTDERYSVAENVYHMPQSVVDICDEIVIPGREIRVVFPTDLLVYIRQYTSLIVMPYGWDDIKTYGESTHSDLREIMDSEVPDAGRLAEEIKKKECHYAVLEEGKVLDGKLTDHGIEEYAHIDGYVIYKNPGMDFTDPYRQDY